LEVVNRPRFGSIGCRYRRPHSKGFHVSLLPRPTVQKGFGLERTWEPIQLVDFSRGEKASRDFEILRLRPDVFEINADAGIRGDADQSEVS